MASSQDANTSPPVKNIMILGATGNIGNATLQAFLAHNTNNPTQPFTITVLTRTISHSQTIAQLPSNPNLQILPIDTYTNTTTLTTLLETHNIEVLISTIATLSTDTQSHLISACISSPTVRRFFPSEYGVDTSNPTKLATHLPLALLKHETVSQLRDASTKTQNRLTYSALITGALFDWSLLLPGALAFNIPNNQVTTLDAGTHAYEATNLLTHGNAIVACLSTPARFEATANQYVRINSFSTTQNDVISLIEEFTGRKMSRIDVSAKKFSADAITMMEGMGGLQGYRDYESTPEVPYPPGSREMIWTAIFGGEVADGLNQYSREGLWNERLGLEKEELRETVRGVVEKLGLLKG